MENLDNFEFKWSFDRMPDLLTEKVSTIVDDKEFKDREAAHLVLGEILYHIVYDKENKCYVEDRDEDEAKNIMIELLLEHDISKILKDLRKQMLFSLLGL